MSEEKGEEGWERWIELMPHVRWNTKRGCQQQLPFSPKYTKIDETKMQKNQSECLLDERGIEPRTFPMR
jgi:hypothetical protein